MKNSTIIHNIRKSLRRQLIFPILLLLLSFTILRSISWENHLSATLLKQTDASKEQAGNKDIYLLAEIDQMYYTGYDCIKKGQIIGHYYYTLIEDNCQFQLIRSGNSSPAPVLQQIKLKGKLRPLTAEEAESLVVGVASDLTWTAQGLREHTSPYLLSTIEYYNWNQLILLSIVAFCILLSVFDLLFSCIYIIFPLRAPTFRLLKRYGEVRTLLPRVEMEMKHVIMAQIANIYLTPNYIVNIDTVRTVILPLQSVERVYYHGHLHQIFGVKFKFSYTLHIKTTNGKTYDFTKKKKEDLDYIIDVLKKYRPGIHLGYGEG